MRKIHFLSSLFLYINYVSCPPTQGTKTIPVFKSASKRERRKGMMEDMILPFCLYALLKSILHCLLCWCF